jgi:hypothetical protein
MAAEALARLVGDPTIALAAKEAPAPGVAGGSKAVESDHAPRP